MILKIYLIGASLCLLWFFLAAILTFEKRIYDTTSEEGRRSIDHMHETLESISPDNHQFAYIIISFIVTMTWPISVPYLFIKIRFK